MGGWQPPPLDEVQAILPAYEFIGLIGCGGMGAVYHARQRSLRRSVAVKILPAALMNRLEANFAERFRREALTMARLNHPGIVTAIESGEAGGFLYFVMEHVDGPDVSRLIRQSGRLAPEVAVSITCQLAEALAYAHASGVIHRDIKPGNILLTRDGRVKVTDFGLACHADDSRPELTSSNVAVGTADYLAPEALRPGVRVDARADLYSLGVTLFQMLSGTVPRGRWKMPSQTLGTDPRLDDILRRALATDPDQRYPDSTTILKELEPIRAGLPPTPAEKRAARRRTLRRWTPVFGIGLIAALGAFLWKTSRPLPREVTLAQFSKREDFLEVPGFGLSLPTSELTIEFWARPEAYRGQAIFEVVPNEPDNQCRFLLNDHGGASAWVLGSERGEGQLIGPTPMDSVGLWTHYALVASRRDNRMQIFTNGVLHAEKIGMTPFANRPAALRIGGSTIPFRGALADFRVWDHARTAAQIQSGMLVQPANDAPGLRLHYSLASNTNTTVPNLASATSSALDGAFRKPPQWTNLPAPGRTQLTNPRTPPRTLVVRSAADTGDGSLRSTLAQARHHDRIRFDPSLSGNVLHLTQGPLMIQYGVDIDARDLPRGFTIDADGKDRVLHIAPSAIAHVAGLTVTNGFSGIGGGVFNEGWLHLEDCVISGNRSSHDGAGVYSQIDTGLVLERCRLEANRSESYAGGLWIGGVPGATVTQCTFAANEAKLGAGAILAYFSPLLLVSSDLTNNVAREAGTGAIRIENSVLHLARSVFSGNRGPVNDPIHFLGSGRKVDLALPPENQPRPSP
jgi:hypothetical protein